MSVPVYNAIVNMYLREAPDIAEQAIGLKVAPMLGKPASDGRYMIIKRGRGKLQRPEITPRAPGAEAEKIITSTSSDTYNCIRRSVGTVIPRETALQAGQYNYDAVVGAARQLQETSLIAHDLRVATQLFNPTNFNASSAGSAYTPGSASTLQFIQDFQGARTRLQAKGYQASRLSLVLSQAVFDRITLSTNFQNFVRGNRPQDSFMTFVTEQARSELAAMLGIKEILVGTLHYDTSKSKDTPSTSPVWGNDYWFLGKLGGGPELDGGAMRTFFWDQFSGDIFLARQYPADSKDSEVVEVDTYTDEKAVEVSAGELIQTSYS